MQGSRYFIFVPLLAHGLTDVNVQERNVSRRAGGAHGPHSGEFIDNRLSICTLDPIGTPNALYEGVKVNSWYSQA